jgi:carboxymethylenebutenolidase
MNRIIAFVLVYSFGAASAQEFAKAALEKSPRHLEYVKVKSGSRDVTCLVAYPEVKEKATAVIVIHEIFGLADWPKSVADQLAAAGYIAIAPDLLSGMAPKGGGTEEFGGDAVRRAIMSLPPDQITADLNAVAEYITKLPAANGKLAVCRFCWGGGQAFRYATNNKDLKASFVFYGAFPHQPEELSRITCPVYGFYGENDARINATIPDSTEKMKAAGKTFEAVIYKGAGHGFLRVGDDPATTGPNKTSRDEAWERWKAILKTL